MKKLAIDWTKVLNGDYFTAIINGEKTFGQIRRNDVIYFCQNVADGDTVNPKFGFNFSWSLDECVTNVAISPKKTLAYEKLELKESQKIMVGDYNVSINKGYIMVGCTRVNNDLVERIAKLLKK